MLQFTTKGKGLNDDAAVIVAKNDSRIHFQVINKRETVNRIDTANLNGKSGQLYLHR